MSSASSQQRAIIGLGCDPARAAFAKKTWEPKLGVRVDVTHNVKDLLRAVESRRYEVFFIAPGMCQLLSAKEQQELADLILEKQPHIKVVVIEHVSSSIEKLSIALGLNALQKVSPMTEAWPFVD